MNRAAPSSSASGLHTFCSSAACSSCMLCVECLSQALPLPLHMPQGDIEP